MKLILPLQFLYTPFEPEGGKQNMYYGASNEIFKRAKDLRNRMTPAEELLWKAIQINEWKLKFRRQHPVSNYIVDFYCHSIKLVIELDGSIHDAEEIKKYDADRESNLKGLGLTVLRFRNEEILKTLDLTMKKITELISTLKNSKKNIPDKLTPSLTDLPSEKATNQKVLEATNTPTLTSTPLGDGGKKKLVVIKIGGNIVDEPQSLLTFLEAFAHIEERKILVHGGGKIATRIGDSLGIESKYVEGRRITDAATLDLVTMVYGGLLNKKIVAQLQSFRCNAIGVTGADANLIPASKRPVTKIDYGFAGDVKSVEVSVSNWQLLLENGLMPVVAPLTHDGNGNLLNTNADTIAQELAKALSNQYEVTLIYSFEKAGVLRDADDENSVIPSIDPPTFTILKAEQKVFAGMIPKLENAFAALHSGVRKVIIGNANNLQLLLTGQAGTTIII